MMKEKIKISDAVDYYYNLKTDLELYSIMERLRDKYPNNTMIETACKKALESIDNKIKQYRKEEL